MSKIEVSESLKQRLAKIDWSIEAKIYGNAEYDEIIQLIITTSNGKAFEILYLRQNPDLDIEQVLINNSNGIESRLQREGYNKSDLTAFDLEFNHV